MRVLVVDDEPQLRRALERALKLEGYDVELAADGEEGLGAVGSGNPLDAIVLDVLMPKRNGLEVARELRARGDHTPILMLTARDAVQDRVDGLDAGADDYVVKPFALEELLARLRALLRRTNGEPVGGARLRRSQPRSRDPGGPARGPAGGADQDRVRPARAPHAPSAPRAHALSALRGGLGIRLRPRSNSLEVYIGYLRRKTEEGGESRLIQTVRGVGYSLRETGRSSDAKRVAAEGSALASSERPRTK